MREDLLGYLLGVLSADEQRRIEDALAVDPQLQRELERLRRSIQPLESLDEDHDPPPNLADRTLQAIERYDESSRPTPHSVTRLRAMAGTPGYQDRSSMRSQRYHISDFVVLALVGMTAITLFLPALANSRFQARKGACQNNLREVGSLLLQDSQRFGDKFIPIPISSNQAFDGVFSATLRDHHMIGGDTAALLCPGLEPRPDRESWSVPTLQQIDNATGPELDRLQQMAGGSYAYVIGYVDEQGNYQAIRNRNRPDFPILADAPSFHLAGRQSANHGGRGQNFFYEDGHVAFVSRLRQLVGDDPLRNRLGNAEYGLDSNDAVLLPSPMPPIIRGTERPRPVVTRPLR